MMMDFFDEAEDNGIQDDGYLIEWLRKTSRELDVRIDAELDVKAARERVKRRASTDLLAAPDENRPGPAPRPGLPLTGSNSQHRPPLKAATSSHAPLTPGRTCELARAVLEQVERAVIGKRTDLELVLLGVLAGGHVLIEDLPGLGKTLMARSFAAALGLDFTRIQFTPDLLPLDVTGAPLYDQRNGEIVFRRGPVFTQLLLADEINRTPPKTQAALLEAMAEGQVSIAGTSHKLSPAFVVLATDNPIEYEGTYSLPQALLDQFLLRVRMGYLPPSVQAAMLRRRLDRKAERVELRQIVDAEELLAMRASLEDVDVDQDILDYVVALVNATRGAPQVQVGASPRGGLALVQLARAVLSGRDYVATEDVKAVAIPALAHRITLRPELRGRRVAPDEIMASMLAATPTTRTVTHEARPGTRGVGSTGTTAETADAVRL